MQRYGECMRSGGPSESASIDRFGGATCRVSVPARHDPSITCRYTRTVRSATLACVNRSRTRARPRRPSSRRSAGSAISRPKRVGRARRRRPRRDQPGVADDVRDLAAVRADDRHLARHRLDQHAAELLLPGRRRQRRQHQHIELVQDRRDVGGRNRRLDRDPIADAELPGTSRGWRLAADRSRRSAVASPPSSFATASRSTSTPFSGVRRLSAPIVNGRPARSWWDASGENRSGIDAELRDDADRAVVPLVAQHVDGLGVAGDGVARAAVDVLLEPAKRRRVPAVAGSAR